MYIANQNQELRDRVAAVFQYVEAMHEFHSESAEHNSQQVGGSDMQLVYMGMALAYEQMKQQLEHLLSA